MDCCQCQGIEGVFNDKEARRRLKAYRKDGPSKTTRLLIEVLASEARRTDGARGLQGMTLLDVGGGVGAVQHELFRRGVSSATDVDASGAYLSAAREEAERQGHAGDVTFYHANFVEIAPQLAPADIVTLDRVICCYHDMQALVGLSAGKARALYGVVYPLDTWWIRAGIFVGNLFLRLTRNPFRGYIHPTRAVERVVSEQGLSRRSYRRAGLWQVVVYAR